MADTAARLEEIVGGGQVLTGDAIGEDYTHDETLSTEPVTPAYVVRPNSADEVAAILRVAAETGTPVTARGSGSGLSGSAIPRPNGILVSFERMNKILEIDTVNHVAVVQPGVTLNDLEAATADVGFVYPVYPGEMHASLGGNVNTNAGGMRAIKYGVTRHHVLGLQAALPSGEVIRTGGKYVKASTGYDLTQLIVGSEGTLALVTEAVLKIQPRQTGQATILVPFPDLASVMTAVPKVAGSGLGPLILEYIDAFTMGAITHTHDLQLGIPDGVKEKTQAYLVVMLESNSAARLQEDIELAGHLLSELGALDVYSLPAGAARKLMEAREQAFFISKAAGADEIIDTVLPRGALPEFFTKVLEIAQGNGTLIIGCGHAGDGNVHLAVFQKDSEVRHRVLHELFATGMALGGAIAGEHGIGRAKKRHFLELEDPGKIELMRRIKQAFDPKGILNPGVLFD